MKEVTFNVTCMVSYPGKLQVPDDVDITDRDDLFYYILEQLENVPFNGEEVEWLGDCPDMMSPDDVIKYEENGKEVYL